MKQPMLRMLGVSSAISLLAVTAVHAEDPVDLTIVSWGGAYTESQVRAYHDPYTAIKDHITIINDDGQRPGGAALPEHGRQCHLGSGRYAALRCAARL